MKNPHIVTRADWAAAGMLEKAIQPGEPADYCLDPASGKYRAVYTTFARDAIGWRYCGRCFAGQRDEVGCNA